MATGVLPLLLGRYTRLAQFFSAAEKHYTGTIRFGFATDTFDAEGAATSAALPLESSIEQLRLMAAGFRGELDQLPPIYSAKKINGVPELCRYHRDLSPRSRKLVRRHPR